MATEEVKATEDKIVAVVVAWNRAELLQETLDGLAAQTRALDAVVVIDNASTDHSPQVASEHKVTSEVLRMPENLGGAGGFAAGIARAVVTHEADYVWIMDDDTVPTATALEKLVEAKDTYPGAPSVLASKAVWVDGREHPMNRPRKRPLLSRKLTQQAEEIGCIPIRTASFVSILLDARVILVEGLPKAAYFLWNDDFEYTSRLLRNRVGLYVPASVVVHKTKVFGDSSAEPGPRFFNETRNKTWMYLRSKGLNPLEKTLYGGKTLLRWGQTIASSKEPLALIEYAWRGIKAGFTKPAKNQTILANTAVNWDVHLLETPVNRGISPLESEKFAVLMSVYASDNPQHFVRALASVTCEQMLKPNQVVLVQDGPVPLELAKQIANASEIAGQPVEIVELPQNVGLAEALDQGLAYCKHELVARADSDDISLPERFKTQIPLMRDHDLLGAAIAEFETDETQWGMIRRQPETSSEIAEVARLRSPFNHPTVVFRQSAVDIAGGYEPCERLEDYWLFARMIAGGARCANLPTPLVAYRVGAGAYKRRGGIELFVAEIDLQRRLKEMGFTTNLQYLRNLGMRSLYRLVPTGVRKELYRLVGRKRWFNPKKAETN
ncbi:glycosyltransferase [Gleimia sp. 6138-11-ORH1]|uniref:glycosyltransferase n=1 Tax=Gleimia sp. 6138-11-ORH1 TaxID=2973937 RepID=UPI00216789A3|nr:glycosyltransferase [Gleimia sp. 6138-11-ORH1]MCS4484039.1 glycosyltransferase [Gleimia sp. 6138-11-ORH1]